MSRDAGFAVMDVSSDLVNDPKIRKLYRHAPESAGAAFVAYVATMGESWKAGRRVTIDDAWPAFLPFEQPAVDALGEVGLLDTHGMLPIKAWRGWFESARARRDKSRDRWARYNAKRDAEPTSLPRGSDADTATSVPPVRPSAPSVPSDRENQEIPPPPAERGRRANGTNPRANGTAPRLHGASPRSQGTSPRTRKRAPVTPSLQSLLTRAAANARESA